MPTQPLGLGLAALAELRERDIERGIDPRAYEAATVVEVPLPQAPPFVIEPPPWSEAYRPVTEERPTHRPPAEREPVDAVAPRRPTPRLDRWRREQHDADAARPAVQPVGDRVVIPPPPWANGGDQP